MADTKHHAYPSEYAPTGMDTDLDRAWEILDTITPGVIPDDVRAFLAGQITGSLGRARNEEKSKFEK